MGVCGMVVVGVVLSLTSFVDLFCLLLLPPWCGGGGRNDYCGYGGAGMGGTGTTGDGDTQLMV